MWDAYTRKCLESNGYDPEHVCRQTAIRHICNHRRREKISLFFSLIWEFLHIFNHKKTHFLSTLFGSQLLQDTPHTRTFVFSLLKDNTTCPNYKDQPEKKSPWVPDNTACPGGSILYIFSKFLACTFQARNTRIRAIFQIDNSKFFSFWIILFFSKFMFVCVRCHWKRIQSKMCMGL